MSAKLLYKPVWALSTPEIGSMLSTDDVRKRRGNYAGGVYCGEILLDPVKMLRDMLLVESWLNARYSESPCRNTPSDLGAQT